MNDNLRQCAKRIEDYNKAWRTSLKRSDVVANASLYMFSVRGSVCCNFFEVVHARFYLDAEPCARFHAVNSVSGCQREARVSTVVPLDK